LIFEPASPDIPAFVVYKGGSLRLRNLLEQQLRATYTQNHSSRRRTPLRGSPLALRTRPRRSRGQHSTWTCVACRREGIERLVDTHEAAGTRQHFGIEHTHILLEECLLDGRLVPTPPPYSHSSTTSRSLAARTSQCAALAPTTIHENQVRFECALQLPTPMHIDTCSRIQDFEAGFTRIQILHMEPHIGIVL
jgi:hypothetical protein